MDFALRGAPVLDQEVSLGVVVDFLCSWAPAALKESYDNVGLLLGERGDSVGAMLTTLDITPEVIKEAKAKQVGLVISHHPLIFKGLKRLREGFSNEQALLDAIRSGIGLYAAHTNLDQVVGGLNGHAALLLGLESLEPLRPASSTLSKLETLVPKESYEAVRKALHKAGAGALGAYTECSFRLEGVGSFCPSGDANPYIGKQGQLEEVPEYRLELILPSHREEVICQALVAAHPYQQVPYYLTRLSNADQGIGSGVVGRLPEPLSVADFLEHLAKVFGSACIRHTRFLASDVVQRVAFCGGAGSFLVEDASRLQADAFVSADFKYHDFMDAPKGLLCCDIGHAESESHVATLMAEVLRKKFPNIAVSPSSTPTNPVHLYSFANGS